MGKKLNNNYGPYLCINCSLSAPWRNAGLVIGGLTGATLGLLSQNDDDSSVASVLESIATGASLGAAVGIQLDQGSECTCDRCSK